MSKVHIVRGDLLVSDCTVIAHQADCMGVMGVGIAKQIRERYPEAYHADLNFEILVGSPRRLGRCSRTYVDSKRRVVINLYGQFRYGRGGQHTNYPALQSALREALNGLNVLEAKGFPVKFGVPYGMGAGLAGGDWNVIYAMLEHLAAEFQRDIYVYKLS